MNTLWVLIVVWGSSVADGSIRQVRSDIGTIQEFSSVERCQFASIEVKKLSPKANVVCVPK
jgi:hypothetical protein